MKQGGEMVEIRQEVVRRGEGGGPETGETDAGETELALYAWVVDHQRVDVPAAAADLGLDPEETAAALDRLRGAGLIRPASGDPAQECAVAPEAATAPRIAALEAGIREQQLRIARIQADAERFASAYRHRAGSSSGLEVIPTLPEVRTLLTRMSAHCREEVLASQPGGGSRVPEAMEEALLRDRALLERGVQLRTLYHHTARFHGPSQAYVAAASALGGQYRTSHELFGRIIVFDRETAFLPTADDSWGAVVVREANTVAYLCRLFDQTWEAATPFSNAADDGLAKVSGELDRTILRLLAAGLKDEAVARRLGMALRTTRRHIADIMDQLSAESRFQAGVAAARQGLLED
ncbi:LuxR C-terminal-related transcriptional regulator [Streptomyces sp. NPDC008001]|uniref:helix-turn-helix transcriptional regulator n=1 Tax=Streptomyces sp. NPDC008001 TaxID=3364804 RepID=UPI0036F12AAA